MVISNLSVDDQPKLKEMCRTRWVDWQGAFEVFLQLYHMLLHMLLRVLREISGANSASMNHGIVAQ